MIKKARKYVVTISALLVWGHLVFGTTYMRVSGAGYTQEPEQPLDVLMPPPADSTDKNPNAPSSEIDPNREIGFPSQDGEEHNPYDSLTVETLRTHPDSLPNPDARFLPESMFPDSLTATQRDSLLQAMRSDSTLLDSIVAVQDTVPGEKGGFLDDIISGRNRDSLVYKAREKKVYIYQEGDIDYQNLNLKADFIEADLETKIILAHGVPDTAGVWTRPEFTESGSVYTGDTLIYNLDTKIGKTKNATTQEGEGYLIGRDIKKMPDNVVNIAGGKYTTCDHIDHPHFYLAMTKAKLIPGEKVIIGPSYLVLEDVPIYFPLIPFGFFPVVSGPSSGFVMPSYGEESAKGFFIRDGGYYFAINDYIDLTLLGGIYTLGSWETSAQSRYVKRYKYSGSFNMRFTKDILGDKGSDDYVNMNNFSLQWTHTQDPKARPNSTFSASVNMASSGYSKYGSTTMNDYLNTQTNSSVSYSKTWAGKPFSLTTRFQHSQYSRDTTISLTFPDVAFSVQRLYPFKRKNPIGKERWYEKISMQYTGTMTNSVTVHERDLFTDEMFKNMKSGVKHSIPVSTSFNLFNYLNISPSFNYNENWYFRKIEREFDYETNSAIPTDTTYGFYRAYNYSVSASASTKIYGMFQFRGEDPAIKAIRHVITPTISASWAPDFGDLKYGFYKNIQSSRDGTTTIYSPYEGNAYSVPGRGRSASLSFSLSNNLEMKVRSDRDTSGTRKIKLIDELRFSGSYNFLAEEFKLSNIAASFRTTLVKNINLNVNATFDPYQVDDSGTRINKFMLRQGKLARLTNASTSFSYSFNSSKNGSGAMNDINSGGLPSPEQTDFFNQQGIIDPTMQRMLMTNQYYDFDIPWNFGFSYSFSYSNNGRTRNVTQTLNMNASVTPTPKWGINVGSIGYDFESRKITPGVVSISRDLHCWTMSLNWVPVGYRKSWSFTIRVKSAVLQDLKYDKRSSYYDNIYY